MNWFGNLRIGTKLFTAFGCVIALTAFLGFFAIYQMARVNQGAVQLGTDWMPSTNSISSMTSKLGLFRRAELQHALSTAGQDKDSYERIMAGTLADLKKEEDAYQKLISTPEEKKLYEEFTKAFGQYLDTHKTFIDLSRQNRNDEAIELLRGDAKKFYDQAEGALLKGIEINIKGGEAEYRHAGAVYGAARSLILGMLLLCVAAGVVLAVVIARAIRRPLEEGVEVAHRLARGDLTMEVHVLSRDETGQLMTAMKEMVENLRQLITRTADISASIASASNQLHSTSEQIATGAEEVASQTNTVATASEEMSATSGDIARNCTMAADAARQTTDSATAGAEVVNETIGGMNVIAERVRQTSKTVEALGARSEQIGDIVGTIEDIADQTNLLALNAAIEAARAGEQGRGFAVVADEVRALAERTTKATREIGEMIKAIQGETREAVHAMEVGVSEVEKGAVSSQKSGVALDEILGRINEVGMQINQIATAAEEQTAATGEVTTNIQQITDVVQQTARGAEETAAAAAQLANQAQELQSLVSRFKLP
ncbi:methyl-accepting chemotaxis protein [Geobacter sp. FeAm09]|uniref:methyl-accepting chemotaxis protein n=1 Tax=Geobacter sp. FeAm09 TaxID=2597769 RepID=UPI0011EE616F|nr:HAMP domain-containing methyl-accepting chemotaxis protein [Geobacter sp. FeAm09]QEM69983.1 methyl-accepting chemotaxis protein [Geobacter sp. FeAm09]